MYLNFYVYDYSNLTWSRDGGPKERRTPKSIPHHQKALYVCFIVKTIIICISGKILSPNHVFALAIRYTLLIVDQTW